jgi:hypothetical protein
MAYRILRTWRRPRASGVLPRHALYHDYLRYATPGNQRCPENVLVAHSVLVFQVAPYASHYLLPR